MLIEVLMRRLNIYINVNGVTAYVSVNSDVYIIVNGETEYL